MAPPPDTIDKAYQIMKSSFIDALTNNAADALIAGEVRASNLLRIPLNFNLINSRAVSATLDYRQTLERFGGSDITVIGEDGIARRVFKPWLSDMIDADKERVGSIIQDAMKNGTVPEKELADVFAMQEHSAKLVAKVETKALYNKGTFERFNHERVQRGVWRSPGPHENPRDWHEEMDGKEFDLDDPVWAELDLPNCHHYCEPVINFGGNPE
jgi:hypothetical protein